MRKKNIYIYIYHQWSTKRLVGVCSWFPFLGIAYKHVNFICKYAYTGFLVLGDRLPTTIFLVIFDFVPW